MTGAETQPSTEYGFYGRLKAEFPSQVIVDATEVCNLECIHCPHPQFKKSEHYDGRFLEPGLNTKLVDEVREGGAGHTEYIRYTSEGEPLIHPKIFELLGYAVSNSGTTVSLTTNGTLLDERRVEQLLEVGVHVVDISIDAFTPETYAAVRVKGDLNVTAANVERLLRRSEAGGRRTKVVVSYVEQPQNQHETEDFERYWRDQGADYVVVRRLHSNAGAIVTVAELLQKRSVATDRHPCLYPWERMTLTPGGHLAFCPQDWVHGSTVTDYRSTTIRETWRGEFYDQLREAHLKNEFEGHGFCGQCPDWHQTRWPGRGRSYADMIEDFKDRE